MWTAAILAGGQGRRLGGVDKSSLLVEQHPIIDRQLAMLHPLTPHILIVARQDWQPPIEGVTAVSDRIPGAGALGGLYTALMAAPTEQVIVMACDMPFVTAAFVEYLARLGGDPAIDAVVPRDASGLHPLCASYWKRLAPALHGRITGGHLRVVDALQELTVRHIGPDELEPYDDAGRLLLNVNTPDDYARAQAR